MGAREGGGEGSREEGTVWLRQPSGSRMEPTLILMWPSLRDVNERGSSGRALNT